ncbi:MAG TPA: hypothetical protein VGC39_06960 [Candidatus Methylacidiphilales bacterium]
MVCGNPSIKHPSGFSRRRFPHLACGAVTAAIKAMKDPAALPGHLPILAEKIRPAAEAGIAITILTFKTTEFLIHEIDSDFF